RDLEGGLRPAADLARRPGVFALYRELLCLAVSLPCELPLFARREPAQAALLPSLGGSFGRVLRGMLGAQEHGLLGAKLRLREVPAQGPDVVRLRAGTDRQ